MSKLAAKLFRRTLTSDLPKGNDSTDCSKGGGGNEVNTLIPVEEENPIFDDWNFLWKSCHQEEEPGEAQGKGGLDQDPNQTGKNSFYFAAAVENSNSPNFVYTAKENSCVTGSNNNSTGASAVAITGKTSNFLSTTGNYSTSKEREFSVAQASPQQYSAVPCGLVEQIRNGLFTNFTGIAAACEASTVANSSNCSSKDEYGKEERTPPFPHRSYTVGEQEVVVWNRGEEVREKSIQPYNFSRSTTGSHNQFSRPSRSLPVSYLLGESDEKCSHFISYTVEEDIDLVDPSFNTNNNYDNNNGASSKEVTGYLCENKKNSQNFDGAPFEAKHGTSELNVGNNGICSDASLPNTPNNLERSYIIDDATSANCRWYDLRPSDDLKRGKSTGVYDYHLKAVNTTAVHANSNDNASNNPQTGQDLIPSLRTEDGSFSPEIQHTPDNIKRKGVLEQHNIRRPTEFPEFQSSARIPVGPPTDELLEKGPNYLCSKHCNPVPVTANNNQSWLPETKSNSLNVTTAVSDSWSYLPAQEVSADHAGRTNHTSSVSPVSPPYSPSISVPSGIRRCSSARSTADRRRRFSPKAARRSIRQSFKSRVLAALSPTKSRHQYSTSSSYPGMGHGNRSRLDSKSGGGGGGNKKGSQKDKSATVPTADFEWEATVAPPCGKTNYIYSPQQQTRNGANRNQKSHKKEKRMAEKVANQEKAKTSGGGGPGLKILSSLPNLVVANVRKLSRGNSEQTSSSSKKRNSIATSSSTDQFPLYPFQWHAFSNQSNHSFSTNDISQLHSANQNHSNSANHSSAYSNNNYEINDSVNYRSNNQMEDLKNKDKRYSWAVGDRECDYLRYESDKFRNYAGGKYGGLLSHSPIREVDYESEEVFDKQQRVPLTPKSNNNNSSNNNGNTENWLFHQEHNTSSGVHTCVNNENSRTSAMISGNRSVQYPSESAISCRRDRAAKSRHSDNSSNSYINNNYNQTSNSNNYNNYRHHQSQQNLPPNSRITPSNRMGRPHSVYVMHSDAMENLQIDDPTRGGFNPGKFPLPENSHWNECNATSYTASQTLESPNNYAAVSSVGTESLNVTSIFGEGVDTVTSSAYSSFADRGESLVTAGDDMQHCSSVGGSAPLNYRLGEPRRSGSMRENQPRDQIVNAWNKEKATIIKLYEQKMAASEKRCRDIEEHYNNLCKTENPQMLREELRRKNSELSAAQNTIRNLSNVLSDKDAELLTVRDQMNSLNQEMQQQTLLIGQLHQKIADNQNSTNYYKAQLSQLQEELHKAFEETAQLKKEMENMKNLSPSSFEKCMWGSDKSQSDHEQQSGGVHNGNAGKQQQQNDNMCGALSKKVSQLERTLANVEQEKSNQLKVFERERVCWLEEKEIVLQYQKQLQANYAHIDNVNKQLQKQVDKQQNQTAAQTQQQHRQHYLQLQQHL